MVKRAIFMCDDGVTGFEVDGGVSFYTFHGATLSDGGVVFPEKYYHIKRMFDELIELLSADYVAHTKKSCEELGRLLTGCDKDE